MEKCLEWAIELPSPPLGALSGPEMGPAGFSHPMAAPPSPIGPCNHHSVTDSLSFPSQPLLPGNHIRQQPQPLWTESEAPSPRLSGEDGGGVGWQGRTPQAGAGSPQPHLPGKPGPWEAGGRMGTRSQGAGLRAESHKGSIAMILEAI